MEKITITATIQPGRLTRISLSLSVPPNVTNDALSELIAHAEQLVENQSGRGIRNEVY